MAVIDKVYAVMDKRGIVEIHTTKAAADAVAEASGAEVEEHKLMKAGKRAADSSGVEGASAPKKAKNSGGKGNKNKEKAYEGIPDCLSGKSFSFVGIGMKLTHKVLGETVTNHGGTIAKELGDADIVVAGKNVGATQQATINDKGIVVMTEDAFKAWVETGDEPQSDSD